MELRVLGPVQVYVGGHPIDLGPPQQRLVLAVLGLEVNRLVPVERLVELIWPVSPPRTAVHAVQVCVSRLRRVLGTTEILRRGSGYVLQADPMSVDVHRFRALLERARQAGSDPERVKLLDEALELWSGPALAGVVPDEVRAGLCDGLEEARLSAVEDRSDARLRLAEHRELLAELTGLVAANPLRERLAGQLMLALYRCGRSGDALRVYRQIRERLANELGLDVGAELRQLELGVLRNDVVLDLPARPVPTGAPEIPAQLPRAVPGFTGRSGEIEQLDAVLASPDGHRPAVLIGGTAGVGKTTLAVHWAHRVCDRFPDGQLYVNLRGFDPGAAMTPAEAVRGFLDVLGVPVDRVPASLHAQAGLYRSRLAGRRMLVVLDNAASAEQVRPLLPGTPSCLVVVTSRNRLTGLVAADGARPVTLDLLTAAEARELLAGRLGVARVRAERAAVDEITALCAGLPLALAVTAARAVTDRQSTLAGLAGELRGDRLDLLDGGDPATQVRAVFSWSYRQLGTDAARLFRLLGVHCGPDISLPAAVSLAGVPVQRLRPALAELIRAHLLAEHLPGRFVLHDLLRAYAADLATGAERNAALRRMLDHYLHTGHDAAMRLDPQRDRLQLAPGELYVSTEDIADPGQAMAWFTAEHQVLLAAVRCADTAGFDAHVWGLAWVLTDFLDRRGYWQERIDAHRAGLDAAKRLGDTLSQARTHRWLANGLITIGHLDEASVHLGHALDLSREVGDRLAQAHTYNKLGLVLERQGRHREALEPIEQSLTLYRAVEDLAGQARALNDLGWLNSHVGNHHLAITACEQAVGILRELGNVAQQADTWDSLGYIHRQLGDAVRSAECYWRAIELYRQTGDRYNEADTFNSLAAMHDATGDTAGALAAWQQALDLFEQIGHADAEQVRAHLGAATSS